MKYEHLAADYKTFRFSRINEPAFRHLKLLLYWPLYLLMFQFVERFFPVESYHVVYCALDDVIPFCEIFLIPYLAWFLELIFMTFYTVLYDIKTFRCFTKFIIITYSAALIIYMIYPTCQNLRPASFERNNVLTQFLQFVYAFDTNTNVCPSIHVLGALGVWFASKKLARFQSLGWKLFWQFLTVLVCLSTVFLKQHSILDILAALPIAFIAYIVCFADRREKQWLAYR